jgi:hypothetical protein
MRSIEGLFWLAQVLPVGDRARATPNFSGGAACVCDTISQGDGVTRQSVDVMQLSRTTISRVTHRPHDMRGFAGSLARRTISLILTSLYQGRRPPC